MTNSRVPGRRRPSPRLSFLLLLGEPAPRGRNCDRSPGPAPGHSGDRSRLFRCSAMVGIQRPLGSAASHRPAHSVQPPSPRTYAITCITAHRAAICSASTRPKSHHESRPSSVTAVPFEDFTGASLVSRPRPRYATKVAVCGPSQVAMFGQNLFGRRGGGVGVRILRVFALSLTTWRCGQSSSRDTRPPTTLSTAPSRTCDSGSHAFLGEVPSSPDRGAGSPTMESGGGRHVAVG